VPFFLLRLIFAACFLPCRTRSILASCFIAVMVEIADFRCDMVPLTWAVMPRFRLLGQRMSNGLSMFFSAVSFIGLVSSCLPFGVSRRGVFRVSFWASSWADRRGWLFWLCRCGSAVDLHLDHAHIPTLQWTRSRHPVALYSSNAVFSASSSVIWVIGSMPFL